MITRQAVSVDPLSSLKQVPSEESSRVNSTSGESTSLAASFVFVESTVSTPKITRRELSRHSTVVHYTTEEPLPSLLECEEKQAHIEGVKVLYPSRDENFSMLVTNYRVLIYGPDTLEIPLTSILDLKSKSPLSRNQSTADSNQAPNSLTLDVKTKDCRFFQFKIPTDSRFLKLIHSLAFELKANDLLPLLRIGKSCNHRPSLSLEEMFTSELSRFKNERLCVSHINSDHSLCPTYPRCFIVPVGISDEVLRGSSKFRDKGRIPVVSWYAKNNGLIIRSSQPRSSLLNRSGDDEEYLKKLNVMFIIDCRPMLNAYANIANGAGVESLGNYHQGIELWFASIQNIHHVRDSWEKMFALSQQYFTGNEKSGWYAGLETTGWYDHITSILKAASVLTEKVQAGINVLCRCSHGLDRTPQVVSLAMIAMDPYYRTIDGFAVLVQKEWIGMGHRFHSRNCLGHSPNDEFSPIFTQWIECVYQVVSAHPDNFEYKPAYLLSVLAGMLSGRFVDFLFDCDKERSDFDSTGESIWSELRSRRELMNLNFTPLDDPISIDCRIARIQIFSELWLSVKRLRI
jgi:phosphatidylinositol-3-phosphatase